MEGDLLVVDDVPAAFCEVVAEAWRAHERSRFRIALSGGETARRCYERLARWDASPVDWTQAAVYWGDERCVPLDDPDSNHRLAREALLDVVGPVGELHPMLCDEADDYDRRIAGLDGLDLVHLGLGPDAHTASLFPGSPALDAPPERFVVGNEDPAGANPHPRLTFTPAAIATGRFVVVTVEGEAKRDALARVRAGHDVPAARVDRPGVRWIVDHAAAGTP